MKHHPYSFWWSVLRGSATLFINFGDMVHTGFITSWKGVLIYSVYGWENHVKKRHWDISFKSGNTKWKECKAECQAMDLLVVLIRSRRQYLLKMFLLLSIKSRIFTGARARWLF